METAPTIARALLLLLRRADAAVPSRSSACSFARGVVGPSTIARAFHKRSAHAAAPCDALEP